MTEQASLTEMLHRISADETDDLGSILAESINLYMRAIKRRDFMADDVHKLFTICRILSQGNELERSFAKLPPRRPAVPAEGKEHV